VSKSTQTTRRHFSRIGSGTSLCLRYRRPQAAERLLGAQLSREAKPRLRWLDDARTHSVAQTCRHFGIARSTFSRWQRRYDPKHLASLANRSSRPHRCRRPSWTLAQVAAVRQATWSGLRP
jgi:Helix-turn-helix domain